MNIHIENKLEQIKAEITPCRTSKILCEQCKHRIRLLEELKELIRAATESGEHTVERNDS